MFVNPFHATYRLYIRTRSANGNGNENATVSCAAEDAPPDALRPRSRISFRASPQRIKESRAEKEKENKEGEGEGDVPGMKR
ncbi:hypothetical protein CVT25_008468 [Psilocybe cyanescens]|uniref:Uncharacterized protein n=1 Tax=Psilocybe cyanescens TaxID=93625 RepID=A0A409XMY4_PSICY|nr:hypothetical protein CVT25_008468 [Psilocybe cyanescens]